jgi:hypothetical protein
MQVRGGAFVALDARSACRSEATEGQEATWRMNAEPAARRTRERARRRADTVHSRRIEPT